VLHCVPTGPFVCPIHHVRPFRPSTDPPGNTLTGRDGRDRGARGKTPRCVTRTCNSLAHRSPDVEPLVSPPTWLGMATERGVRWLDPCRVMLLFRPLCYPLAPLVSGRWPGLRTSSCRRRPNHCKVRSPHQGRPRDSQLPIGSFRLIPPQVDASSGQPRSITARPALSPPRGRCWHRRRWPTGVS